MFWFCFIGDKRLYLIIMIKEVLYYYIFFLFTGGGEGGFHVDTAPAYIKVYIGLLGFRFLSLKKKRDLGGPSFSWCYG